ncbi:hypothetical protein EDB85DRAFT_2276449 [Lactarius pseudohatsudake]|nr:hypothetical protein EDB85DRAFT_2276449 [Lactarius pseudohatsudake]
MSVLPSVSFLSSSLTPPLASCDPTMQYSISGFGGTLAGLAITVAMGSHCRSPTSASTDTKQMTGLFRTRTASVRRGTCPRTLAAQTRRHQGPASGISDCTGGPATARDIQPVWADGDVEHVETEAKSASTSYFLLNIEIIAISFFLLTRHPADWNQAHSREKWQLQILCPAAFIWNSPIVYAGVPRPRRRPWRAGKISRIDSPAVTCANTDARYQRAYDLERHHASKAQEMKVPHPMQNIPGLEPDVDLVYEKRADPVVDRGTGAAIRIFLGKTSYLEPTFHRNRSVDPRITEVDCRYRHLDIEIRGGRCETRVECPLFARERVGRVTIEVEPEEPELGRRGKSNKILTTSAMKNPLPSISSTPRETREHIK